MSRYDWERSVRRPGERGGRERTCETRRPAQDPAAAVRALQATIGNAAIARAVADTRTLQRMKFERFERYGFLTNWGWYSNEESGLLKAEADLATYISGLEKWATGDDQVKALLAKFVALEQSTVPQSQCKATRAEIARIDRELKERRAALLNENPSRREAPDPTFFNRHPDALVGEIQQFLGRWESERQQERERRVPATSFRIVIPVPGEHQPLIQAHKESPSDPDFRSRWRAAIISSIKEERARLHEKLESYGIMNWTYSTDGLLSVGSTHESKHSVVGAGADVWAAGTVKLKITEGETLYKRYKTDLEKAESFKAQAQTVAANASLREDARKRKLEELHANRAYYEQQAVTDKKDYEALGFRPEEDAAKIGKTVVVDFDSGHYTPSEAWRRTASAWRKLGYTVEFNPEGRTA